MANPAVEVAKGKKKDDIVTLSTGIRAKLLPVPASLMQEVVSRLKEPAVPWEYDEALGRDAENPHNLEYRKALAELDQKRAKASIDAMAMFGIELIDGLPEDGKWLAKLKRMESFGYLDLSEFDLEDEFDLEFLFKRFIALGNDEIVKIGTLTGISQEGIDVAENSFPG
jgi:hypothetical protein